MQLQNTVSSYGLVSKLIHWLMALMIVGLIPLGYFMSRMAFSDTKLELYSIHKSFGLLVLLFLGVRLIWRFIQPHPKPVQGHKKWEKLLAHGVHGLLYVSIFAMPISGWLMTSAGNFPHNFFGLFTVPPLVGQDKEMFERMREVHDIFSYIFLVCIGLHAAGALKHHIIDRDTTLRRMIFGKFQTVFVVLVVLILVASYSATAVMKIDKWFMSETVESVSTEAIKTESVVIQDIDMPRWIIDHDNSRLAFTVSVQGAAFSGEFQEFDGDIIFDPDNLDDSSARVAIKIASVSSGSAERDDTMQLEPWFHSESFPESRFETTRFEKKEDDSYVATGNLTIRGVTNSIELPFTLEFSESDYSAQKVQMKSTVTIDRRDFGVGQDQWKDTDTVAANVEIIIDLTAIQQEK